MVQEKTPGTRVPPGCGEVRLEPRPSHVLEHADARHLVEHRGRGEVTVVAHLDAAAVLKTVVRDAVTGERRLSDESCGGLDVALDVKIVPEERRGEPRLGGRQQHAAERGAPLEDEREGQSRDGAGTLLFSRPVAHREASLVCRSEQVGHDLPGHP